MGWCVTPTSPARSPTHARTWHLLGLLGLSRPQTGVGTGRGCSGLVKISLHCRRGYATTLIQQEGAGQCRDAPTNKWQVRKSDMGAAHSTGGLLEMSVSNTGFLLDRLGQDCHPLQFLRELTQNSIEAVQRAGGKGTIIWDADWATFDLEGTYKLCITDDGAGMTGDEMIGYINRLSSSVSKQSFTGNYGVGAKIATLPRNHAGVVYLSWKDGQGSMIQMLHESGRYGLKQWVCTDGGYVYALPLDDSVKPDLIGRHGTKVVLVGDASEANTMKAPPSVPCPSRWVTKYLNSRYFRFPEGITVKAREGWEHPRSDSKHCILRTVTGQGPYLNKHSRESGSLELSGAVAHWWILRDERAVDADNGMIDSAGHTAALYQNELYEHVGGRAGVSRLLQFGVTFGYRWVVIYVEPEAGKSLAANTARTHLLLDSEPLPWSEWAAEFRERMPAALRAFITEKSAKAAESDHAKAIRDRLKEIMDLFRISRYRPVVDGRFNVDADRLTEGHSSPTNETQGSAKGSGSNARAKPMANVYAVFERPHGTPSEKTRPDPFPKVDWVSIENGTRESDAIEDRAAKYLPDQNRLLINADFRVFKDMEAFLQKELGGKLEAANLITDAVRNWFEQALVETVLGVQGFYNSKEWTPHDIDGALSEEGLTAAVMQRYHVLCACRRELGSKIGAIK